ncbi:MAG: hypothetical protein DWQ05_22640 [Calditrichaeota bacterium]|nr:MAG: hypothetical protein DWQ05_22640 [Calditrichota bacterium]
MRPKTHIKIFAIATLVWAVFVVAGLPDYYLQHPATTMVFFDIFLIIPFSAIIYHVFIPIKPQRRMKISLWYAFYFTVPFFLYDWIFCGLYLGHGFDFLTVYWFLTVYYFIPWVLFPLIAYGLNHKNENRTNKHKSE